ncbi:MAG: hypothetical protein H6744_13020 [Deltaproteobacteria bacterium]|nr:hypothetical protein [Deltaproteobacteria bacterium]
MDEVGSGRWRLVLSGVVAVLGACGGASGDAVDAVDAVDAAEDAAGDAAGDEVAVEVDVVTDGGPDGAAPQWPWPRCEELSAGPGSLLAKARTLDALVVAQHLGDRLLRTVVLDEQGRVSGMVHVPSTGLWTAMYLASQAFRFAVTGEPEARDNAAVAIAGLHDLTAVTGVSGLYGRAYQRAEGAYAHDAAGAPTWVASTAPGYEGWWWNATVSKDTMDGIVFGYAAALEHLDDPQLRATVATDLTAFVRSLVANGLQILDHDGLVTEHGRLYYSAFDDFPGFNALLALSWVKVGADASGDQELAQFFDDCLLRLGDRAGCPELDVVDFGSYLDAVEETLSLYLPDCQTNYDNIDMVFHAVYPLMRREQRPALHQRLRALLERGIWQPTDDGVAPPIHAAGHALYTFMYGGLAEPGADDATFRAATRDALCTLHQMPVDRRDRSIADGTQPVACHNRHGHANAAGIIPLAERYYDNYLWRLDPYEIPRHHEAEPGLVHSPEDFLLAYWMGRYHGYISPEE